MDAGHIRSGEVGNHPPDVADHSRPGAADSRPEDADHNHHPVDAGHIRSGEAGNHPGEADSHLHNYCYVDDSLHAGELHSADQRQSLLDGNRLHHCLHGDNLGAHRLDAALYVYVDEVNVPALLLSENLPAVLILPVSSRCSQNPC